MDRYAHVWWIIYFTYAWMPSAVRPVSLCPPLSFVHHISYTSATSPFPNRLVFCRALTSDHRVDCTRPTSGPWVLYRCPCHWSAGPFYSVVIHCSSQCSICSPCFCVIIPCLSLSFYSAQTFRFQKCRLLHNILTYLSISLLVTWVSVSRACCINSLSKNVSIRHDYFKLEFYLYIVYSRFGF